MRKLILTLLAAVMITNMQSQENNKKNPVVQDLDFLIGTWEVEFDWYDTHKPGSEPEFSEKGTMVCYYDLDYRGTKKFIFLQI